MTTEIPSVGQKPNRFSKKGNVKNMGSVGTTYQKVKIEEAVAKGTIVTSPVTLIPNSHPEDLGLERWAYN